MPCCGHSGRTPRSKARAHPRQRQRWPRAPALSSPISSRRTGVALANARFAKGRRNHGQHNRVVLVGNLTRDPELRQTPSGTRCKLRVAVNTRQKDSATGQWGASPTTSRPPSWGNQGESCAQYLAKGRPSQSTAGPRLARVGCPGRHQADRQSRSSPRTFSSSAAAKVAAKVPALFPQGTPAANAELSARLTTTFRFRRRDLGSAGQEAYSA